jgi:hypothetical protein
MSAVQRIPKRVTKTLLVSGTISATNDGWPVFKGKLKSKPSPQERMIFDVAHELVGL